MELITFGNCEKGIAHIMRNQLYKLICNGTLKIK